MYNARKSEEIVGWRVGSDHDVNCCIETLYRAKNGQFFLETWHLHKDYQGPIEDIKLIAADAVWPLLADRKVDPNCITKFFYQQAQVIKDGELIGVLRLLGK